MQKAEFPQHIVKQLGDLGCFWPNRSGGIRWRGLDYISYGLMMQELERATAAYDRPHPYRAASWCFLDLSIWQWRTTQKYLPKLASGEWLGCFGLTWTQSWSDPAACSQPLKDAGEHVILNGAKMWISNAPFSQVAVVWGQERTGRDPGRDRWKAWKVSQHPPHMANGAWGQRHRWSLFW